MLALGVLLALLERQKSGVGQVVDASMLEGANYIALPLFKWAQSGLLPVGADGHMKAKEFVLCALVIRNKRCMREVKRLLGPTFISARRIQRPGTFQYAC